MPPKVVPIRPPSSETVVRKSKIDLYGEVKRRLALCEPDELLAEALKEEIESWHKDGAGDTPVVERGNLYEIQLSPRRNERTLIDKRKAFNLLKKALGLDGLIAVIDIPFGAAIDKVVPKSEQKAFVTRERSGARTLRVVPLHAAEPPSLPKAA